MAASSLLIGDLGGTHARFALVQPRSPGFSNVLTLDCGDHDSAEDAIEHYLERTGAPRPRMICLAVAGPVVDQRVRFLNINWRLDAARLRERFPSARVRLVNDFTAIAYAVPQLGREHVEAVGLPHQALPADRDFTVAVLGPGTGLGVSGLMRIGGRLHAVESEGGHAGFAPETSPQLAVLQQLRQRFERVSDERLLSGPGIENIYWALNKIEGRDSPEPDAAEIFRRAQANEDEVASETVQLFFEALGQVAGNLALTLGAHEGIYIAGGIVRRYPELLKSGSFRSGFENKGRHRSLMERVPTHLITHRQPGLLGAGYLARRRDAG